MIENPRIVLTVRPYFDGWQAFEDAEHCPVFPRKEDAFGYAMERATRQAREIQVTNADGTVERIVRPSLA